MKPLSAFVLLFAAAAISQASTTWTVNDTITLDPNLILSSGGYEHYTQALSGGTAVTVQTGDIITGTISFVGGPILIEDVGGDLQEFVQIYVSPTSGSPSTTSTSNITYLGLHGILGTTNPAPLASWSGGPFVADQWSAQSNNGGAFNFSFTSFSYTINITGISTPTSFAISQLALGGQTVEFGQTSSAPEPSSLASCGVGCAALLWLGRRGLKKRAA